MQLEGRSAFNSESRNTDFSICCNFESDLQRGLGASKDHGQEGSRSWLRFSSQGDRRKCRILEIEYFEPVHRINMTHEHEPETY
jgi:hypothetical protein